MTAVAKTYTFVPGTPIESDHANQNFDDLVNYTNGEVIVRDASMAFTAIPSGPGTDPTSPNQFARKQYVDNKDAVVAGTVTALTTTVTNLTTTVTTNKTAQDAGFVARPTVTSIPTNPIIKATDAVVSADANGQAYVPFESPFPNAVRTVVVSSGDNGVPTQFISVNGGASRTTAGFWVTCYGQVVVAGPFGGFVLQRASGFVRVSYVAVGH
jgi:hypothetical protein